MDDVVKFLSGEYGIRQPGKSVPMAAYKSSTAVNLPSWNNFSSNSGMSSNSSDGVLEEKNALSSAKKDNVLESLGMGLTETKGLGFEELVYGNKETDDPFLIFETAYPSSQQSSVHSTVISSAFVDERDVFDISGGIGRSKSSFASEETRNICKVSSPSPGQSHGNAQKFIVKEPPQSSSQHSNSNARTPNPSILGETLNFSVFMRMLQIRRRRQQLWLKMTKVISMALRHFSLIWVWGEASHHCKWKQPQKIFLLLHLKCEELQEGIRESPLVLISTLRIHLL